MLEGLSILLVDPDLERRAQLAARLARARARPIGASDGRQALQQIEALEPDVILCDQEIRGHSATDLCEYIKDFGPAVPFVLMAPERFADPAALQREVGADAVLLRPLDLHQLGTAIRLLAEARQARERADLLQDENRQLREALRQKAIVDPQSGYYRFDLFRQVIVLEVKRARRYAYPLSILLMAFDNFDKVAGYLTPEQRTGLYRTSRRAVTASVRDIDIALLFAEDKVLVVMPHTDLEGAAVVADRIRDRIGQVKPPESLARLHLSVSIAVASSDRLAEPSFGGMIRTATRALKEADLKGGNVVLVCRPQDPRPDEELGGKLGPRTYFV
ncbi:MAG: diguanylate cyclase [Deltaproteobacteria bacterium]|nr:diguanylate cyclase [Deltaproteobacteria bacterium]